MTVQDYTQKIRAAMMPAFMFAISQLAKRAEKLNFEPVTVEIVRWEEDENKLPAACVKVHGFSPRLEGGWQLLGRIDFVSAASTIYQMSPGVAIPENLGDVNPTRCDRCGTRRRRNDLFIVESREGEQQIVGRRCLKDFLGHRSPAAIAAYYASLESCLSGDEESWGGGYGGPVHYGTQAAVALAIQSIRDYGWVPSSADCRSTRAHVGELLHDGAEKRLSDEDKEQAAKIIAWVREQAPTSDYMQNLKAALSGEWIGSRALGLTVSAPRAYQRATERAVQRKAAKKAAAASEFVGEVKKRGPFTLTLLMERGWETEWGYTHFYRFVDGAGNTIVTKRSRELEGWEIGETHTLVGTVKEHSEYRGEKQTVLTRTKF